MQISGLQNLIDDFELHKHNLEPRKAKVAALCQSREAKTSVDITYVVKTTFRQMILRPCLFSETSSSQIGAATVKQPLGHVRHKALAGDRASGKSADGVDALLYLKCVSAPRTTLRGQHTCNGSLHLHGVIQKDETRAGIAQISLRLSLHDRAQ